MIQVTEPFLPPQEEYQQYLDDVWKRNWLTNNGPLVNELEIQLKKYLGLDHLLYVSNGTIALQLAIKALNIDGEIITTPFSYVATTSATVWEGCSPVFVDIEKDSFNIDPEKIESAITENTSAIIATHVFGNPCRIDQIQNVAEKYNLKVIYDAAHCFGVKYKDRSVFEFGDVSTASFHATKLFHTIEGGAIITKDPTLLKKVFYLRNFGHDGPDRFNGVGINGKNSEFHAAMGLCNLKYADQILEKRKEDFYYYNERLDGLDLEQQKFNDLSEGNFSYYPILFNSEKQLLKVISELESHRISPRRYFYPLLSKLDYVKGKDLPIAEGISKRILCLPLSHQISKAEIDLVCRCIKRSEKY